MPLKISIFKTLRKSSKKLFLNFIIGTIFFPTTLIAQEKHIPPGIFKTIDNLITNDNKEYSTLYKDIQFKPISLEKLEKLKNITLHPTFSKSIFLHSNSSFLNLAAKNTCQFYSFLQNSLISRPNIISLGIPIQYKQENKKLDGIVSFKNFFIFIYKRVCKENNDIQVSFKIANLKNTLKKIKFPIPNKQQLCHDVLKEWQKNKSIGSLCRIGQVLISAPKNQELLSLLPKNQTKRRKEILVSIRQAEYYKKILTPFQADYVTHLCSYLDESINSQKIFCDKFITDSFWKKTANNYKNSIELDVKCQHLFNKKNLSPQEIKKCAEHLTQDKNLCHYLETKYFPALAPMPSCDQISEALTFSKLQAYYQDCPGKVNNEGIINVSRLLAHFKKEKYPIDKTSCRNISVFPFVSFNLDNKNKDGWKPRLCYEDPIQDKKICLPVIIGQKKYSNYSEASIVAKILYNIRKAPKSLNCTYAEKLQYNPSRIKYQDNCILIYDKNNCTSSSCPKKIIFKGKEIKEIIYSGTTNFDYFPNSAKSNKKSISFLLERFQKLNKKTIKNISSLKYHLLNSPLSLIHGRGCIEDIYPQNFKKLYMNQCSPVSFIIDGFIEKNFRFYVIIRTGIDSIHSPRIINWKSIYNAITNYQKFQPINHWTLYGIK